MNARTEIIIALIVALIAGIFSIASVWYEHQLENESEESTAQEKQMLAEAPPKEIPAQANEKESQTKKSLDANEITELAVQAAQGDMEAQYKLAKLYETGDSIEQNWFQAIEWYRKAAEQGSQKAQLKLAKLYSKGEGVSEDLTQAAHWTRQAAEQGSVTAQYQLARLYEKGRGVEMDTSQAVHWYQQAADQGHQKAKSRLEKLQASAFE